MLTFFTFSQDVVNKEDTKWHFSFANFVSFNLEILGLV